ncbi:hypothetical protein [Micromonospora sp. WMMD1082]|uniref:hypothetical protein n=1 Tax=Micromonospora sp. WMMD1082 TaxID=3016104 RepID=UPI00241758B1|nr:hypothetical protein [Micromonospora sp. WMMD1082]MDG4794830.1 hypothetical protein [Micromonospora sp. WMMD1082]
MTTDPDASAGPPASVEPSASTGPTGGVPTPGSTPTGGFPTPESAPTSVVTEPVLPTTPERNGSARPRARIRLRDRRRPGADSSESAGLPAAR